MQSTFLHWLFYELEINKIIYIGKIKSGPMKNSIRSYS